MAGQIVSDAITEWWVHPIANGLTSPDRTVFGAISANLGDGTAQILACELDHDSRTTTRVPVAVAPVDDHNAPTLWAMDGHRTVIVWSHHGFEALAHVKVSDADGSVESLATAVDQPLTAPGGVAYGQLHRIEHLSDAGQDMFWLICRIGTQTWRMTSLSVDQATGAVTQGSWVHLVDATQQAYVSSADAHADGDQVIRMAWGYNPAADFHQVYYLEINAVTGALTSPVDAAFTANLDGTNLPMGESALTPLLPDNTTYGQSRRLHYVRPGPASPAVGYAEWDLTTPDDATYKIARYGAPWSITEYGTSGPRVGFTEGANYIAGLSFPDPCPDDTFAIARQDDDGTDMVELWTPTGSRVLRSQVGSRLIRPVFVRGHLDRVLCSDVSYYGALYDDYLSDVRALFDDPGFVVTEPEVTQVVVGELRTGVILSTVPVSAASWEQVHRDAGSIDITVPLTSREVLSDPDLLSYLEGPRCFLAIQHGDTILEAGPIWAWSSPDRSTLKVGAAGLMSYFDHRIVMRVLAATADPAEQVITWSGLDLGTIAARHVKLTESHTGGALPIVYQAERTGTHERTYQGFRLPSTGREIRDLMDVEGGPDIALRPRLTTDRLRLEWLLLSGTQSSPLLSQDGDDHDLDVSVIRSTVGGLTVGREWGGMSMRHWATGEGTDEATLMTWADDTTLVAAGFPLLESTSSHTDVSVPSTLTAHARAQLASRARAEQAWTLTVRDGEALTWRPGDWVRVWPGADDPLLTRLLREGRPYHRARVVRMAGDMSETVRVTLMPEVEAR